VYSTAIFPHLGKKLEEQLFLVFTLPSEHIHNESISIMTCARCRHHLLLLMLVVAVLVLVLLVLVLVLVDRVPKKVCWIWNLGKGRI
jgi:hypothetical protein